MEISIDTFWSVAGLFFYLGVLCVMYILILVEDLVNGAKINRMNKFLGERGLQQSFWTFEQKERRAQIDRLKFWR